jgi:hypothetical protein
VVWSCCLGYVDQDCICIMIEHKVLSVPWAVCCLKPTLSIDVSTVHWHLCMTIMCMLGLVSLAALMATTTIIICGVATLV